MAASNRTTWGDALAMQENSDTRRRIEREWKTRELPQWLTTGDERYQNMAPGDGRQSRCR